MPKFEIFYHAEEKIQIRKYEPIDYGHQLKRVVEIEHDIDTDEGLKEIEKEYMLLESVVEAQVLRKRRTAFTDFKIGQGM